MHQFHHLDATIRTIVVAVLFCGLLTMRQRETLLTFAENQPTEAQRIAIFIQDRARRLQSRADQEEYRFAQRNCLILCAKRISDMRHKANRMTRLAQSIQDRASTVQQETPLRQAA